MPVKPGRKRVEDRETRVQAILDAALDVFSEKGFAASRLEDVAVRAGVAKGTIYLYFASKEALFEALIRSSIALPIEAVRREILSRDLPAEAALRVARRRTGALPAAPDRAGARGGALGRAVRALRAARRGGPAGCASL